MTPMGNETDKALVGQIHRLRSETGLDAQAFASAVGMTYGTLHARMENPKSFRFGELQRFMRVAKRFDVPFEVGL